MAFWDVLYVLPVMAAGRLGGMPGGVAAGALATALVASSASNRSVSSGPLDYLTRAGTFVAAGVIAAFPAERRRSVDGSALTSRDLGRNEVLKLAELGTWELDLVTDAMTWSSEYHNLYGVDPDVFPSSRAAFEEIVHPDDRGVLAEAIRSITEDGVVSEVRYRIVRPGDHAQRCIRSHMRCERDTSGRPRLVLGTGQDVTDLVMVLSRREREMMMLLAEGLSGEQIAERLTLSPATVRTHVNNAMIKLGAHTRGQAIAIALRSDEIGS